MNYSIANPAFDADDFSLSIKRCSRVHIDKLKKQSTAIDFIVREYIPTVHNLLQLTDQDFDFYESVSPILTKIVISSNADIVFEKYRSLCSCCKEKMKLYNEIVAILSTIDAKKDKGHININYSFGNVDIKKYLRESLVVIRIEELRALKRNFNRVADML